MVMSAALVFGTALTGCDDECARRCDDFVKCMRNLRGGTLKKGTSLTKKECRKQCKRDKKLIKELDKVCR